jgi:hypothetical protein
MTTTYAPRWALSAQAIDAAGDPHLAKGVHLRLLPSAALGLPLFPYRVHRLNLGKPAPGGYFRNNGLRYVDSKLNVLTPPFNVAPGNPVTVYLPPPADGLCCWIEVQIEASPGALRADAQVAGDHGVVTLGTANAPRFQFAASHIDRVVLTGTGLVMGALWVDARPLDRQTSPKPWRDWSLPVASGPLYTATATALAEATNRVKRGAPLRQPMFMAPAAAEPAAAPQIPNPPLTEQQRIDAANGKHKAWLSALVAAGNDPPPLRTQVTSTGGSHPVKLEMGLLNSVWTSAMDPGMNRWFGFGDVDETSAGAPGDVVAYIVRGIWQQGNGPLADPDLLALLNAGRLDNIAALNAARDPALAIPSAAKAPFYDLYTVACVTLGKATASPPAPQVQGFEYRPFMPAPPPAARREIVLKLRGLLPGPGAALARKTSGGAVSLNPTVNNVPVGLLVTRPEGALESGTGRVSDRQAPAEAVTYRVAQCDGFGRWSPWTESTTSLADRPRPPVPVLQVSYSPPPKDQWGSTDALPGLFTIVVPVPPNASLAPGSLPLSTLLLDVGGQPFTANPAQANAKGDLVVKVPGPALLPCASAQVAINARWQASGAQPPQQLTSEDAMPVKRTIHDPRAPAPVSLSPALDYGSRPDATGKSRIDLRWQAAPGQQRFRVYYASETSLLEKLRAIDPELLGGITHKTAAERATLLHNCKPHFDRSCFELLTGDPLEKAAGNNPEMRLVHEVSGQLATLGLYRVASVSAANVEGDFAATPMIAFAVPSSVPPAQPLLEAGFDMATRSAVLKLNVPRGAVPAAWYRLRRTTGSSADAANMRVVQEGPVPPAAAGAEMQQLTLGDPALPPWKRYAWCVEVRGADLPGSTLKGEWSRASAPAELLLTPATPPDPVSDLTFTRVSKASHVGFVFDPAVFNGGSVGRFKLELYRHAPDEQPRCVAWMWADQPVAPAGEVAGAGTAVLIDPLYARAGTVYRVLVTDPLGRTSSGNPGVTVPE